MVRLPADAPTPNWARGPVLSITRTPGELSIVCEERHVPGEAQAERGWRCLGVAQTLDFGMVGVLSRLTTALAEAGISLFALSTFDTDYLLVRQDDVQPALAALDRAGFPRVEDGSANSDPGRP